MLTAARDAVQKEYNASTIALGERNATENERKNRAQESISYATLGETSRANQSREQETKRSNLAQEREQARSNRAREQESQRAAKAQERLRQSEIDISKSRLAEEQRSNKAKENISWANVNLQEQQIALSSQQLAETVRHNQAVELQTSEYNTRQLDLREEEYKYKYPVEWAAWQAADLFVNGAGKDNYNGKQQETKPNAFQNILRGEERYKAQQSSQVSLGGSQHGGGGYSNQR